jgi:[acyl-carrier-protein] S-malonyltransferase
MRIAWLFPGQGSQEVGMGQDVSAASSGARKVFENADRALGRSIRKLCFEGPLDELTLTKNTQPAIVVTSCAIAAALVEHLPELEPPVYAAGHSLGEYSALVAAGAIEVEEAVTLCRVRGAAMQDVVPPGEGAMAAVVRLDADAVVALCADAAEGEVVAPANYNGPGQVVIAGHARAVARACALAAARGGKAIPLKVSAPFHCALMRPAAERLLPALDRIQLRPLAFPVIANVDAEPNTDPQRLRSLLVRQMDGPVHWVRTIERMAEDGVTHALELGPGKVLAGLVKRITKQIKVLSVNDMAGIQRVSAFLSEA